MPSKTETLKIIGSYPVSKSQVTKLQDNVALTFGSGSSAGTPTAAASDASLLWNGTNLVLTPTTDDTGAFHIGDGTTDMDFKVFLGTTSDYILADVGNKRLDVQGATTLRVAREAKLVESDYDPATRTYHRFAFDGRAYSQNVMSDWSVFKSVQSANNDWVFSKSATAGAARGSSNGCMVLSGSNSSSLVFLKPRPGSRLSKLRWDTSKSPRFRLVFRTGTITDARIQIGLFSAAVPKRLRNSTADSNRVELYLDEAADSRWHVAIGGSSTGSSSVTLSGVVASSTIYDVDMRVSSSRILTVYINGTLLYTSTLALAATTKLIPVIGLQSEGAKRNMELAYGELSMTF